MKNEQDKNQYPLLATAQVLVQDKYGTYHSCRVLLDNAATSNFITIQCATKLQLPKRKTYVPIDGLGHSKVASAKGIASLTFCSIYNKDNKYYIEALMVPSISSKVPATQVDTTDMEHIKKLQLADPDFHQPARIDILVGAELYYELTQEEKISSSNSSLPYAINTSLGWIIGGGKNTYGNQANQTMFTRAKPKQDEVSHDTLDQLETSLKRFWEIEAVPVASTLSKEESSCEQHFQQTVERDTAGRFVVRYPFKAKPETTLGKSLLMAKRRFTQVERRLQKDKEHRKEYLKFMQEYESLGHMVEVEPPTDSSKFRYYIPHHFVLKESSTTTKFRVVFDASAKTDNGISLNDIMMNGPVLQDNLTDLIMRFRKHKIAITADIEKMYRQVLVHPDDQEYQYILWREAPDKPLKHYKLLTITYGTAAGPYLATKVLQTLATIEEKNFPIAAKVLKEDFYIDDCMTGSNSEDNAIILEHQLIALLKKGCMSIRKFTSNSEKVLQAIPEDLRETKSLSLDKEAGVKALGIFWNPSKDFFGFKTNINSTTYSTLTKRCILSEISKLFDPIGWLSPVVIVAKILMQSIWKEQLGWDEEVPDNIKKQWEKFKAELKDVQKLKIPREQIWEKDCTYLVGFSDASEQAYSACVYLCTYKKNGAISTSLVAAKTRVAPIKKQSLPRLELCASLLLAEFMPVVAAALKLDYHDKCAFSDSTLALNWIQSQPYLFKNFIGNRIAKIQELIAANKWGFVQGIENPADCASRGISMQELLIHPLWWTGPKWLREGPPVPTIPLFTLSQKDKEVSEIRQVCNFTSTKTSRDIFSRYSTLTKLQRVTAYILRFANMARASVLKKKGLNVALPKSTELTPIELKQALLRLISLAQEQEFSSEIGALINNKPLAKNSKILSLNPFFDDSNILRVGGRLRHAKIPDSQKHPILLPQHHRITKLIIDQAHIANLHAGPQTLLSFLHQRYWIVRGKDAIRNQIRKCVICTRHKADTMQQMMGDLPSFRVNQSYPFQNCGIDYAGPFLIRPINPRSKITLKAYIAIFICCATRAIHLEVVSAATTQAFIAALRRFMARRGKPSDIYSDNGTNFVGANNELKELIKLTRSDAHNQEVANVISKEGIMWHFNPPAAPHFGGLWEAGVKSTKFHLRRVMGKARLTFEELTTLIAQIEAILNSRPLTPETPNPSDLRALTPGHFLIGQPLTTIPEPDITTLPTNRLVRWQLIQQMLQQFWKRWTSEYISRLQQRPKWMQSKESICVGSLVIIKDENLPPLQWKLGRVIAVYPGNDGHVRTVKLKIASGEIDRPIVKLCLLPIEPNATQGIISG